MNDAYRERFGENPPTTLLLDIGIPTERSRSAVDDLMELVGHKQTPPHLRPRSPATMEDPKEEKPSSSDSTAPTTPSTIVRLPNSSSPVTDTRATGTPNKWVHYDEKALKAVGAMCGNRLPPATSVQAMFLYEMQRQTEQEQLFHGEMFRLARAEDDAKAQQTSIKDLGKQLQTLQKQVRSKDVDERLATSKMRMDAQSSKINEQSLRINDQNLQLQIVEQRVDDLSAQNNLNGVVNGHTSLIDLHTRSLAKVEGTVSELETSNDSRDAEITDAGEKIRQLEQNGAHAVEMFKIQHANIEGALASIQAVKTSFESSAEKNLKNVNFAQAGLKATVDELDATVQTLRGDMADRDWEFKALKTNYNLLCGDLATAQKSGIALQTTNEALNQDIAVLFDERDMLIQHLDAACARIDKLEGTVRALTGQATSPTLSTGSNSPHMVTVSVQGSNGKTMDLAVPKGSSVVEYRKADGSKEVKKENSKPIRPFTPGKPWENNGGEAHSTDSDINVTEPVEDLMATAVNAPTGLFSYFDQVW